MSPRLAFVRHGAYAQRPDTPSAMQPFGLTAAGEAEVRQQARQFAVWLAQTQQQLDPRSIAPPCYGLGKPHRSIPKSWHRFLRQHQTCKPTRPYVSAG